MHDGPISCLALDEQLVFSGSTSGRIALTDVSTGERVASLSSSFSPLGNIYASRHKSSYISNSVLLFV